jgi:hypothetical protein
MIFGVLIDPKSRASTAGFAFKKSINSMASSGLPYINTNTAIRLGPPDPNKNLPVTAGYPQPVRPELDPNNLLDRALISLGRSAGFLDDHKESGTDRAYPNFVVPVETPKDCSPTRAWHWRHCEPVD